LHTAARVYVRRRSRLLPLALYLFSGISCFCCHEPQNAHLRTPSGISDPHDLQFISFSSSIIGSLFFWRSLLVHHARPNKRATTIVRARIASVIVRGNCISVRVRYIGLRIISSLRNVYRWSLCTPQDSGSSPK
jgi:hypothetical protein